MPAWYQALPLKTALQNYITLKMALVLTEHLMTDNYKKLCN